MQPEQLGPYRIDRQIGRGGMGTVYAGVDVNTGESAAVKVLDRRAGHRRGLSRPLRHRDRNPPQAAARQYRAAVRLGRAGRHRLLCHGADRRHQPGRRAARRPAVRMGRGQGDRRSGLLSAQARARPRCRAPRHQAGQPAAGPRRQGQALRLRHRQAFRQRRGHDRRRRAGHRRVHGARAGRRPARRPPRRSL